MGAESLRFFNSNQTATVGSGRTGSNGTVSIGSVPAVVRVYVSHEFGVPSRNDDVAVATQGRTLLSVIMPAGRPRPTVALLPVSIKPGSVSDDRSELTLEVTLVASSAAPFTPAGYGDYSSQSTPALGLALGQWDKDEQRQCFVWLDRIRTEPSCGTPWGSESPYTVSVERFTYDRRLREVPDAVAAEEPATGQSKVPRWPFDHNSVHAHPRNAVTDAVSDTVTAIVGHRLGKVEAVRRLKEGFARTKGNLGLIAMEQETWDGDTLRFRMRALGQTAAASIEVLEDALRIQVSLPWLLAKAVKRLLPILRKEATLLLEKK